MLFAVVRYFDVLVSATAGVAKEVVAGQESARGSVVALVLQLFQAALSETFVGVN